MSREKSLMEVLIEELRTAAQEEAQRILKEAEEQAAKIIEEAKAKAEELKAQRLRQLLAEARQKIESELAPRRLEVRRKYLAERYNYALAFLEDQLAQVVSEVKSDKSLYSAFLSKRLEEAIRSIKSEKVVVHPCRSDADVCRELLERQAGALSKLKPGLEIRLGESVKCSGGFIAASEDGKEYFNGTIEARLAEIREKVFPEILTKVLNSSRS